MSWDVTPYILQRLDDLAMRMRTVESKTESNRHKIDSLELWRTSLQHNIRRWPYVVGAMGVIILNAAPAETVKLAIEALKVLI